MYHPQRVTQWLVSKHDWLLAKAVYPIYMEVSPFSACNPGARFARSTITAVQGAEAGRRHPGRPSCRNGPAGRQKHHVRRRRRADAAKEINEIVSLTASAGIDVALSDNCQLIQDNATNYKRENTSCYVLLSLGSGYELLEAFKQTDRPIPETEEFEVPIYVLEAVWKISLGPDRLRIFT